MTGHSRRQFLCHSLGSAAAGMLAAMGVTSCTSVQTGKRSPRMRFGLVTYQWAKDWDLPTLIRNCETTGVLGVELRWQHAHGIEAGLNAAQRREVKKRFDDSAVTLVGLGPNFDFHHADGEKLRASIEGAKQYVVLSHDVGGSGIKVRPNDLPDGVPVERTIEQIGRSLNELGRFAANYGQQIRVEVHGRKTSQLPIMKRIFDVADHPSVGVCWNSNPGDLGGEGLEQNFNLVKHRLGATAHVRELNAGDYPYQHLIRLFIAAGYKGWILLEAGSTPPDRVKALAEQRAIFEQLVANAYVLV